jgi:hypothetical protein
MTCMLYCNAFIYFFNIWRLYHQTCTSGTTKKLILKINFEKPVAIQLVKKFLSLKFHCHRTIEPHIELQCNITPTLQILMVAVLVLMMVEIKKKVA